MNRKELLTAVVVMFALAPDHAQADAGSAQGAGKPVLIPNVRLENSKFMCPDRFSVGAKERGWKAPGIQVTQIGFITRAHYRGAVYEALENSGHRYVSQTKHIAQDAFIVHFRRAGKKRVAGVHCSGLRDTGNRFNVEIEIPTTLMDKHSCYTSLVTYEKDMRIETVVLVAQDGKFVIREIRVTNMSTRKLEKVEVHEFVNLPYMDGVPPRQSARITYDKEKDILLATPAPDRKGKVPDWKEVCGMAAVQRSSAHSIEHGGRWGQNELLRDERRGRMMGRFVTGESNNAETGNDACIFVWDLGDLKPGASGTAAAVIAVGDDLEDFNEEVAAAKSLYASREPLAPRADRKGMLAKYAKLNWRELTNVQHPEYMDPADPDNDGWDQAREKAAGTNPMMEDTDVDGLMDYEDPNPTKAEPLIKLPTAEELRNDKIIGLSKREIIRAIRGQHGWLDAGKSEREITKQIGALRHLRVNCVAVRVDGRGALNGAGYGTGNTGAYKAKKYGTRDVLADFIAICHRYDIDVQLEGMGMFAGRRSLQEWLDKPGGLTCYMSGANCMNGWMRAVRAIQIYDTARYPVEFISIDEEQYFRCYFRERFQTRMIGFKGSQCMCPTCVDRFKAEMGHDLPGLYGEKVSERQAFEFNRWRVKCSTEAWKYWNSIATDRNPEIKFFQQSVNEGGVYRRHGRASDTRAGIGPTDMGYKAPLAYGGDHVYYPYRYSGKKGFNHFIYPAAMKAAMGTVPSRKGWVEYGGAYRNFFEPVWCYGSFISPIAHGGKAVEFFDQRINMGFDPMLAGPKHAWKLKSKADAFEYLRLSFVTLDEINDWVFPAVPPRQIAVLWSEATDSVHDTLKEETQKYALAPPGSVSARLMSYLFRTGYPFDIFYQEYVDYEALKDYPVLVMPAPLCLEDDRIPILEKLVKNGASLVIMGEYGQLNYDGRKNGDFKLLTLAGVRISSNLAIAEGPLITQGFLKDVDTADLKFRIRKGFAPNDGTQVLAKMNNEEMGIYMRELGKGRVLFMPGGFVRNCISPPAIPSHIFERARTLDITKAGTKLMNAVFDYCLGDRRTIIAYNRIAPDAHADTEIALLEQSDSVKTLFVLNWEETKKSVIEVGLRMPAGKYGIQEWSVLPSDKARIDDMKKTRFTLDGKKVFTAEDLGGLRIELEPQQIRILHLTKI